MQVKFELNHSSNYPGCVGQPGDVVVCSKEIADEMVSRKGGVILEVIKPEAKGKQSNGKSSAKQN
jgi:hypothetical protein